MQALRQLPRVMLAAVLFGAALFAVSPVVSVVFADIAVPALKSRVTDLTATLSADEAAALESKLAAFEQRKGSQLAVLIVPTTQPETIEQYGIRVAEQWKLGRKGVDDGVLLLIATDDRKLRIEVGRGLEGALPDATARRVIDEYIVGPFKQREFNAGIQVGVDRIIKIIDGEPLPEPKVKGRGASSSIDMEDAYGWGALLVVIFGGLLRSMLGSFLGAVVAGAIAGGVAVFLGEGALIAGVVGFFVFLFCLIGLSFFSGGGLGGSSGSSWGGGGGSFGGGGASGSW